MSLFDKFKKKDSEQEAARQPANPTTMVMFRVLAVGYVLWIVKDLVAAYIAGGEEAPSLGLVIGAGVVLVGGCVFVAIMTFKQWKALKAQFDEYNEQVAAEYAAEEAAKEAACETEDPSDDEDMLELPEAEEAPSEIEE